MSQYKRILVVCDPAMQRTPAIERAARLAQATGASLRLGLFDFSTAVQALDYISPEAMTRARDNTLKAPMDRLRTLLEQLRAEGVDADSVVRWGAPLHEAIIAQVADWQPDLVIKDVETESAIRRLFYTPLDWRLLRLCPAPLLLVNAHAHPLPRRVIAAVDTTIEGDEAEALNDRIVHDAVQLALQSNASLHLAYSFEGLSVAAMPDPAGDGMLVAEAYEALRDMSRKRLEAFAERHSVPRERMHFLEGPTADTIADLADTADADVVVLGSVYRQGLERLLMGSSAERILQRLHCDVLVVKPADFADTLAQHRDLPGLGQRTDNV